MAAFAFQALDPKGREQKGVLEGDSARQIRQQLRDKGWAPLKVSPVLEKTAKQGQTLSKSSYKLTIADLTLITRQLAVLVQSALPLEEAIKTIAEQSEKAKVKQMMLASRAKILEGHSLADSLAEFPRTFSTLYRATVAAGEHTGHLDLVLSQLADYLEYRHAARQKIQMAMLYPSLLIFFSIGILVFLLAYVVPKIVNVFMQANHELPLMTKALIGLSNFVVAQKWVLLGAIILIILAFWAAIHNPTSRLWLHQFSLRIPLFGKLISGSNVARFATTLSILQRSGVPLVDALQIAGQVVTNERIKLDIALAAQRVREGGSLFQALEQAKHFPPMMLHMIRSGEVSGELSLMLQRAASTQEMRTEATINTLLTLFEPLMLIFMGGSVLVIVLAIMLPIMQISQLAVT